MQNPSIGNAEMKQFRLTILNLAGHDISDAGADRAMTVAYHLKAHVLRDLRKAAGVLKHDSNRWRLVNVKLTSVHAGSTGTRRTSCS